MSSLIAKGMRLPVQVARRLKRLKTRYHQDKRLARIRAVLADGTPPDCRDAEAAFDQLQAEYPPRPEYGYDDFSLWTRASGRVGTLLRCLPSQQTGYRTLEVGCGDAIPSYQLATYGHHPTCTDLEDWRNPRAAQLPFHGGPLERGLPEAADTFDLVFSYNTFEHLDDLAACLKELVRVTKPGGIIYSSFGPLYASPWGLHAYRMLRMPYPQFLFGDQFVLDKLHAIGIRDLGKERDALQPMNRWTPSQYDKLWQDTGCDIAALDYAIDEDHLELILRFPSSFHGRHLTTRDVTCCNASVCLRKPMVV